MQQRVRRLGRAGQAHFTLCHWFGSRKTGARGFRSRSSSLSLLCLPGCSGGVKNSGVGGDVGGAAGEAAGAGGAGFTADGGGGGGAAALVPTWPEGAAARGAGGRRSAGARGPGRLRRAASKGGDGVGAPSEVRLLRATTVCGSNTAVTAATARSWRAAEDAAAVRVNAPSPGGTFGACLDSPSGASRKSRRFRPSLEKEVGSQFRVSTGARRTEIGSGYRAWAAAPRLHSL